MDGATRQRAYLLGSCAQQTRVEDQKSVGQERMSIVEVIVSKHTWTAFEVTHELNMFTTVSG